MAKPGPRGTIYFIAELGFDGRPSGMVKIGIVKDSDRSRTVEQRCDEHQTGNPNQLEVIHTVLSPMPEETDPRIPHRGLSRTPVPTKDLAYRSRPLPSTRRRALRSIHPESQRPHRQARGISCLK